MTSVLFQPFHLHELTLPNRMVLAPLTRSRAGTARLPNRLMAEYYSQRSSAGLLITEATTISEEANGWNETPGVYTDEMRDRRAAIMDGPFPMACPSPRLSGVAPLRFSPFSERPMIPEKLQVLIAIATIVMITSAMNI
jgi:hypothetical protein